MWFRRFGICGEKARQEMKSKLSTLGFVFILSALIFSGCSLATAEPTPTPGPTPTPPAVQAPGWVEVTVHILCLDVEQSYPEIEGKSPEPIAEEVQGILAWVGIQAVAEGEPCDASLTITLACEAIGDSNQPLELSSPKSKL